MHRRIPEGYHSVTPCLVLNDAAGAIQLYAKAFGAQEIYRVDYPNRSGKIMHACIRLTDSRIFIKDINPKIGYEKASISSFYLYLDDVDLIFRQAKEAGFSELSPVRDMFWGDRAGTLIDLFGIHWTLTTHVRDVTVEELERGRRKWMERNYAI